MMGFRYYRYDPGGHSLRILLARLLLTKTHKCRRFDLAIKS